MNLLKGGLALHESFRNSVDIERHPRLQEVIGHQTFATVTNLLPLSREMYFFPLLLLEISLYFRGGCKVCGLKNLTTASNKALPSFSRLLSRDAQV